MAFPQVIELNVGGRYFTTSLATLKKDEDSKLADMFSGGSEVKKDKDGRYFIDANGDVFIHILEYLRFKILPPPERAAEVLKYAKFFRLESLQASISKIPVNMPSENAIYSHWTSKMHRKY